MARPRFEILRQRRQRVRNLGLRIWCSPKIVDVRVCHLLLLFVSSSEQ